jgi:hypothetical protein
MATGFLKTRLSTTECSNRLSAQVDQALVSTGDDNDLRITSVEEESFVAEYAPQLGSLKIPFMRYKGEIIDDPETGGARIEGSVAATFAMQAGAIAYIFICGQVFAPLWAWTRTQFASSETTAMIACWCVGALIMVPMIVFTLRAPKRIREYLARLLDAEVSGVS